MLSVLIPAYNYDVFPLVEKLLNQCEKSGIEFEILIVDDASQKYFNNLKINEFQYCVFEQNPKNLGRTQTRKRLAEKAKFDNLLFLDADVLPVKQTFITDYVTEIIQGYEVVFGGYCYADIFTENTTLRYNYGKSREEKPAVERNKKPYQFVFSGNMLIKKDVFLTNNFNEKENLYGMDIFFSYNLHKNKIHIKHIDNAIIHNGLETNEIFFEKSLKSVESRKKYLANAPDIEQINYLLKYYKTLQKYGLTGLSACLFKISESYLKKKILSENPNFFLFDLYRLGYICTIK